MPSYITQNRALTEGIRSAASRLGLTCDFFSDEWMVRLSSADQTRFVFAYGFDCNGQAAATIASDKVATFDLLQDRGVAAVPHYLIKSGINLDPDMKLVGSLLAEHGSLVIKPLSSSRGQAVRLCRTLEEASEAMSVPGMKGWAASPLISIQKERRLVVYDGQVRLGYEKTSPIVQDGVPMFNLNLGAQARTLALDEISEANKDMAVRAMQAIGLTLGAVDIAFDEAGNAQVLEINSGFSLEHFAHMSSENREAVVSFYEGVVEGMFTSDR